jgi:hypothetical protein
MGATAAAVIIHKEKEIVAAFRGAGATSPNHATTSAALGLHEGLAFAKLRRRAVLREAGAGRLYLDEPSWEALRATRRRMALTLLAIALLVCLGALLSLVHQ